MPDYRITLQSQVISPEFRACLVSLPLHDRRGMQADQLDINNDMLDIPLTGAELILVIGWKGQPLSERGTLIVDEVEHTGTPDTLNIRASSANLR